MVKFKYCSKCDEITLKDDKCSKCKGSLLIKDEYFLVGRSLGKYLIEDVIGSGGMGVVYLGKHKILKRYAAIKVIIPSLYGDYDAFYERFLREAQVLATLRHENIVSIYDFDITTSGIPFYAMEYLHGVNLREVLLKYREELDLDDFKDVLKKIASALDYAHEKGVVHRDLKPENILFTVENEKVVPKLIDFGVAKILGDFFEEKTLTAEGSVIGTINYMAPEQFLKNEITPRVDQYALALIVSEIILKKPLRANMSISQIIMKEIKSPVSKEKFLDICEEKAKAIEKATSIEPENRFNKVLDFIEALNLKEKDEGKLLKVVLNETIRRSQTQTLTKIETYIPHSESKEKPEKRLRVRWLLVLSALILIVSVFYFMKFMPFLFPLKEDRKIFEKIESFKIPPLSEKILGFKGKDEIVLKGKGFVAITKMGGDSIPAIIPIKDDEEFIKFVDENDWIVRIGRKIRRVSTEDDFEKLLFELSDKEQFLSISESLRKVLTKTENIYKVYLINEDSFKEILKIELEKGKNIDAFFLSDKYFSYLVNGKINVYNLEQKTPIFENEINEQRVKLVVDDFLDSLFVMGWFDKIYIFSLKTFQQKTLNIQGRVNSFLIMYDLPTLIVGGERGIRLYNLEDLSTVYVEESENTFNDLFHIQNGIVALDYENSLAVVFKYGTLNKYEKIKVFEKEVWGLAKDPKYNRYFASGLDTRIVYFDRDKKLKEIDVHNLGVSSLLVVDDKLYSCSDDKTIGVFKIPSMELKYRSSVHNFLINSMVYLKNRETIWTSSSDGTLKSFSVVDLKEKDVIDLRKILNRKVSLHGFWVSEEEDEFLVGTWNNILIYLKRDKGSISLVKVFRLPSMVGFEMYRINGKDLIFLLGTHKDFNYYLFDLRNRELYEFPPFKKPVFSYSGKYVLKDDGIYISCLGGIGFLRVERKEEGFLGEISLTYNTAFEVPAILICEGDEIVIGNEKGFVFIIKKGDLNFKKSFVVDVKNRIEGRIVPV